MRSARRTGRGGSDRGVSETLGFVFVFAIVLFSVSVVYVGGMGVLTDVRDAERANNAERAFDVFADNVDDVVTGDAPSRSTEMKLSDSRLYVGDPVTLNVTGTSPTADPFTFEYEVVPIVYDGGDETRFVYAGGAAMRTGGDGGVVLDRPPMVVNGSRVVLPIVQTRSRSGGIGGSTTVLVRARAADRALLVGKQRTDYDLTVNVTSPRASLWREMLLSYDGVACPPGRNTDGFASCTVTGVERVYVTVVRVDVTFER